MTKKLTEKQKRFVDEYLIDLNATQAAIRAGYSQKTAYAIGEENLRKPEIRTALKERIDQIRSGRIADTQEIMEYLTSVMRGESVGEELVNEFIGDGCSQPTKVQKAPSEKDKLKAAELLGKRYGMFKDKVEVDGNIKAEKTQLANVLEQLNSDETADPISEV